VIDVTLFSDTLNENECRAGYRISFGDFNKIYWYLKHQKLDDIDELKDKITTTEFYGELHPSTNSYYNLVWILMV
jgi:hypothetical protein